MDKANRLRRLRGERARAARVRAAARIVCSHAWLVLVERGESYPVAGMCECGACGRHYPPYYVARGLCYDCWQAVLLRIERRRAREGTLAPVAEPPDVLVRAGDIPAMLAVCERLRF
jgi:hypothetical protein